MATDFDLVQSTREADKPADVRDPPKRTTFTLGRVKRKRSIFTLGGTQFARAETKSLRRLLNRSGVSAEDVSRAIPVLSRCLVQRQIIYRNIFTPIVIMLSIILTLSPFIWDTFFAAPFTYEFFLFSFPGVCLLYFEIWGMNDDEIIRSIRLAKNSNDLRRIIRRSLCWWLIFLFVIFCLQNFALWIYGGSEYLPFTHVDWVALLVLTGQSLLMLMYLLFAFRIPRIILYWRVPELSFVRTLTDAFEMIADASPATWRSISLRSKAARYIDRAAATLEGPIARKFAAPAGPDGAAAIHERFLRAGGALRSKVAWLATPKAQTKEFLARALAEQLLIAATGDLDRLDCAELDGVASTTIGWLARFRATASMAVLGLGPAILFFVNKWADWIHDPAGMAIFAQFAAISFFVAVLSTLDPTGYKERLGSVIGTGAGLFGWRPSEKKG
jgi:hypothetical protein